MAGGTFNIPPESQWDRLNKGQGTRDVSRSARDWAERNAAPLAATAGGVASALAARSPLIKAGKWAYGRSGVKDFLKDKGIYKREPKGTGESFRFQRGWRDAASLEELRRQGQKDAELAELRRLGQGDPGEYGGGQQDIETELRLGSGDVLRGRDLSRDRPLRRAFGDEPVGGKGLDKASRIYDELRRRLASKKEDIAGRNPSLIPLFGGGKDLFDLFDPRDNPDLQIIQEEMGQGDKLRSLAEQLGEESIVHGVDAGKEMLRQLALDRLKDTGRIKGPGNENPIVDWLMRKLSKSPVNIKKTPFGDPADYSIDRGPGDSWGPPNR